MNYFFALVMLLAPTVVMCSEQNVACPSTLGIKSSASPIPGWQVLEAQEPHVLDHLGVYFGNPSELASSVPQTLREKSGASRDIWTFDAKDDMWIACFYSGTSLFIAKPLGPGHTRCEADYASASRTLSGAHCH